MLILKICQSWELKTPQKPGFADLVCLLKMPPFPHVFYKIKSHLSVWKGSVCFQPGKNKDFPFWVYLKVQWAHLQKDYSCHFSLITTLLDIPAENKGQSMTGTSRSGVKLTDNDLYLDGLSNVMVMRGP